MIIALQHLVSKVKESTPRIGIAVEEFIVKFEEATTGEKFTGPSKEGASLEEIQNSLADSSRYQALLKLAHTGLNYVSELVRLGMDEQAKFLGVYIMYTLEAVTPDHDSPQ